jgi:acyl carrier protein
MKRGTFTFMSEEIFDRVKRVVVDKMQVKEDEVTMDSSFMEDLGGDSLTVVELIMALEEEFGIDIPDDDVNDLKTVGNVVDYITKKLAS